MRTIDHDFERLSALLDGELSDDEFDAAFGLAAGRADARSTWHVYHLVGEVMRSPELASTRSAVAFAERLSERLRREAVPVQHGFVHPFNIESIAQDGHLTMGYARNDSKIPVSANEGRFAWQLVAGFASLAVVAALGWNLLAAGGGDVWSQLALQPAAAPISGGSVAVVELEPPAAAPPAREGARMIRDPRLDELMAAHRQSGSVSALQNPSGFLRNATFGGSER